MRAISDAVERDLDVCGDGLQSAPISRRLRILHLSFPDPHRLLAWMVFASVFLRGVSWRGAQQPLASFLAFPCRHRHVAGDHRTSDRDCERLGTAGCVLGQVRGALLVSRLFCFPLHCAGLHQVRFERHVRRCALPLGCILHADPL